MKKRWIWGVLIALCMMLGMTAAAAEGTPAKVTFKANGRTTTVNVSLPHTFEGNRDKEQDELDRIIRYLYGYNGGVCEVDSAPVATGNPKVKAGLIIDGNENKKGHYITIDGVFTGTATVKAYYLAGSKYFQYTLEITTTVLHTHSYANEWSYDASGHWHACISAGQCDKPKGDAAPHSYGTSGDARFTCQCGYVDILKKDAVLAADKDGAGKAEADKSKAGQNHDENPVPQDGYIDENTIDHTGNMVVSRINNDQGTVLRAEYTGSEGDTLILQKARNSIGEAVPITTIGDGKNGILNSKKGRKITRTKLYSEESMVVEKRAFKGSKVKYIKIGSNVTIKENAFKGTKQKKITIRFMTKKASSLNMKKGAFDGITKVTVKGLSKNEYNKLLKSAQKAGIKTDIFKRG